MFGQIPDFSDGFELLRKMWGNAAGMPGGLMPGLSSMTPPMDLEEVDKRISELKTVESWLQLNTNLLRTTIQGLEVQRATLVALKTFGNALSPEAMQNAMENVARAANAPSTSPPKREPRPEPARPAAKAHDPDADNNEDDEEEVIPGQPPFEPEGNTETPRAPAGAAPASATPELPPNANLWWDMVQQQFNQIASTAAAASMASLGNMGGFGAANGDNATAAGQTGSARGPAAPAAAKRPAAKKAAAPKAGATPARDNGGPKGGARKPAAKARGGAKR
jgi:ribosomal protein L12E/L44/L45/RPP1/RPP2